MFFMYLFIFESFNIIWTLLVENSRELDQLLNKDDIFY